MYLTDGQIRTLGRNSLRMDIATNNEKSIGNFASTCVIQYYTYAKRDDGADPLNSRLYRYELVRILPL
jgi:hypothetical protein